MTEIKTEGQRLFCEVSGTERGLALKVGCGKSLIGYWRRGQRMPSDEQKHKLELLFGIPQRAWDVPPGTKLDEPVVGKKESKVESKTESKAESTLSSQVSKSDTLSITKAQIDEIVESLNDNNLTNTARSKLRDTLTKLLALQGRLERDQELREDRYVREHPRWLALKKRIVSALEPYPQAAKAVLAAISSEEQK